jgi:hypothetical protein
MTLFFEKKSISLVQVLLVHARKAGFAEFDCGGVVTVVTGDKGNFLKSPNNRQIYWSSLFVCAVCVFRQRLEVLFDQVFVSSKL